ncbi:MAG: AGE family epimerase/isomerase [Mucilaginibacter sp.]
MKQSARGGLLDKWYPLSVDTLYGGFLSAFTYNFKQAENQDKMIVTQARHTWSNAKAALMYPTVPYFKTGAKHGFQFLRDVLWDKTNGGFYTFTNRQGEVKKGSFAPKEAYGNSFAIYALAAYYQESGDTAGLNLAKKAFWWLEKHSHDPVYKGYYQHMELDGTVIKRTADFPSVSDKGYKDQNTSIHLLEAYTELYTVWPDKLLRERLSELLFLVRDKITTPRGNLQLFFQSDWTPVSTRDSSDQSILKHRYLDHVSFGHDVETAYLMLEASHVLGIHNDTTTLRIAKKMVDHALKNGWDSKVGGFYDEGYYYKDKPGITIIKDGKNWWAQAEGLNALLMMSDRFPKDSLQYYAKFKQLWAYTQTYLIDHENGDWYQGGIDKEPDFKMALKGQIWKGTYHNFRALMNCILMLDPDKLPPSTPKKVTRKTVKDGIVLQWKASKDNRQFMGYNIFANGKRIGYTPLTYFMVDKLLAKRGIVYTVKAVDMQGNKSLMSAKAVPL